MARRARAATDVVRGLRAGLETPLGKTIPGGVELSGGRWQKLALMMRERPLLLVLDEPTSSLDPHGRIVEQGSHDQLVAIGGVYAELFALQAAAYA